MPFLNKQILESAKNLQLVQFASVGYDRIDLETANSLGIPIANNEGVNAVTVAEHAMMMILVLQKKAFLMHQEVMRGTWPYVHPGDMWELKGRTLGILGLGIIGTELAKITRGFGARILYNKRNKLSLKEERELGVEYRSLPRLLKESDILSVHIPLNDETRHIIGSKEISLMKNSAILINTSRKDVIDEIAAAHALRSGKLYGVGIDVPKTSEDRASELKELFMGYNAIITSHTASESGQIMDRFTDRLSEFVRRATKGEPPLYPIKNSKVTGITISKFEQKRAFIKDIEDAGLDKSAVAKFYEDDRK